MGTNTSKSLFNQAVKEILATNYVAAELLLQQASEINEEGTTLYAASWAVLLTVRDRVAEAIELLEERLEEFSTDPNLLLAYGLALEKLENFEDAEHAFRESLESDPENAGALRGLSVCLEKKGDLIGGCRLAAKAFSLVPDNLVLAKNAAELLLRAGQKKTAHEVVELGAHYNPEDEELVTKAIEGCLTRSEPDRAWELLLLVDEAQSWAAGWKASFLDWRGDEEHANHLIQTALQRKTGENNDFLFHLCCILMRRGQVATAEAYLEHILNNDPQHPGALRMKADFSMGRFEYNPLIDPLAAAVSASTEVPGWARFWFLLNSNEIEDAEETLAQMAEDEDLASDPVEVARLELAENLFLALSTGEAFESETGALDELPDEAGCGILLEFLEVVDGQFAENESVVEYRDLLNDLLGLKDPILRLTRFYAREEWNALERALEEFDQEPELETDEEIQGHAMMHKLYTLLHALGTGVEQAVDDFELLEDPEFAGNVVDVLVQKREKNPTEQRFLDKLQGEIERVTEREIPEPQSSDDSPSLYEIGGVLDTRDQEIIIYETEDGEVVTDFDESEYEIVEEIVGEPEPDPEDDDYEYVWVEEEILIDEDDPEFDDS